MAKDVRVRIIGDPSSYKKAIRESEQSSKLLEKQNVALEKSMHHVRLGAKDLVAGMIGAGGLAVGLEQVVEKAKQAQESQDHLAVTMKDAGLSYEQNRAQVEKYLQAQSELAAFQTTDLRESFGKLIAATKDTAKSQELLSLATDIARGRHISLEAATQLVIKANIGMVGSLRRMGIEIQPVHDAVNALTDSHKQFTTAQKEAARELDLAATKQKAIAQLQQTYSGQAKAYGESAAGAADKFKVALTNLEIKIGTALLPALTKLAVHVTAWLEKAEHSKKLQHDLNTVFDDTKKAVDDATGAFKLFADAVGGSRNAVELLGTAFATWKLAGTLTSIGAAAGKKGAAGDVGLLTSRLKTLSAIGLITIDIQIALHRKGINDWMNANIPGRKAEQAWLEKHAPGYKAITDFFGTSLPDGGSAPTTQSVTKAGVMTAAAPFAGVPYQWGGGHGAVPGPSFATGHGRSGIGLDCSGYARAVLANMGITVNGNADSLLHAAKSHPARAALQPGDLVFYEGTHPNHVMVYIGNGQVIGETHTGASGPEVKPVGYMKITGTGRYVATENASTVPAGGMPGTTPTPATAPKSTSAINAIVAGGASKAKKGHVLSGTGLLSGAVRTGLARAEGTPGDADDLKELEAARAELEKKLRDAHGKQRVAIEEELGKTNKAIDVIEKRHADARARADKAAYAARVSAFKAHLDELKRAADEKRQAFETAFGLLAQKELAGFDRQTSLGVASLDAERATLTESEQKIKDIEDAKARAQRDAAVAAAQSDLAKAIADGDPDAVKTAQQALSDAQLDVQLAALQEQAATERAARDKLYADKAQAYQDDRDLQRDQLQAWLDEQQAKLETGATQWATFWAEIKDQAAAAGIDTSSAFWKSFEAAGGMASGALSASRAADVATSVVPGGARVGTSYGKNSYVVGGVLVTPGFARGVRGFGGGLALVGEEGPELVNLPGGSDVISSVGAAGVVEQHTHVYLDGEEIFHSIQRAGNRYNKRNGRGGSGV